MRLAELRRNEKKIEGEIIGFLDLIPGCIALKYENVRANKKRALNTKGRRPGVPDIIASIRGRTVWIEVKDKTGKLSVEQSAFIYEARAQGDIAFVARSVDEVSAELKKHFDRIPTAV